MSAKWRDLVTGGIVGTVCATQIEEGMERRFLFGQPVLSTKPSADGRRSVFVLGAYPSALHVRWFGPDGNPCIPLIKAVAVDNEPEPFWDGNDERERVERWAAIVSFCDDWGHVEPCGHLNGSSGKWVQRRVLDALGVPRGDCWITDCLDTYHESDGAAQRRSSEPMASVVRSLGVPEGCHRGHPSESEIVRFALAEHRDRLIMELDVARPECVVTLGNAALRVFGDLAGPASPAIKTLSVDSYGSPLGITVSGQSVVWLPLAHPASPAIYQTAHTAWADARRGVQSNHE